MRKKIFAKEKEKEYTSSKRKTRAQSQTEGLQDDGRKVSESLFYKLFVRSAYRLLQKPLTVFRILKKSMDHFQQYESIREFAKGTKEHFDLIIRMIRAYAKGEYNGISKTNVALSLAAILYFLSPIDLIPDFLAAGLLDDLALLTWLYNNLQGEIEDFLTWEEETTMVRIPIQSPDDKK